MKDWYLPIKKATVSPFDDWFSEYREQQEKIMGNLRDLAVPSRNRDWYRWQMKGSYSRKLVLPALVPGWAIRGWKFGTEGWRWRGISECADVGIRGKSRRSGGGCWSTVGWIPWGMVRLYKRLKEIL